VVALYALVGVCLSVAALVRASAEEPEQWDFLALQMQIASLFWCFLAAVGVAAFLVLHVSPYVI
jgi:hypothetical protein